MLATLWATGLWQRIPCYGLLSRSRHFGLETRLDGHKQCTQKTLCILKMACALLMPVQPRFKSKMAAVWQGSIPIESACCSCHELHLPHLWSLCVGWFLQLMLSIFQVNSPVSSLINDHHNSSYRAKIGGILDESSLESSFESDCQLPLVLFCKPRREDDFVLGDAFTCADPSSNSPSENWLIKVIALNGLQYSLPRSRFLDVTQRSPKRNVGERCVTSKKRLRRRLLKML